MGLSAETEQRIRRLYVAFNARDIDGVLVELSDDVDWGRAFEGGYAHGPDGVRAYWTKQFSEISAHVEPLELTEAADGDVHVRVHQVVRNVAETEVLDDATVRHRFHFSDGRISRFDADGPVE